MREADVRRFYLWSPRGECSNTRAPSRSCSGRGPTRPARAPIYALCWRQHRATGGHPVPIPLLLRSGAGQPHPDRPAIERTRSLGPVGPGDTSPAIAVEARGPAARIRAALLRRRGNATTRQNMNRGSARSPTSSDADAGAAARAGGPTANPAACDPWRLPPRSPPRKDLYSAGRFTHSSRPLVQYRRSAADPRGRPAEGARSRGRPRRHVGQQPASRCERPPRRLDARVVGKT